jgi:hypothetical protein
MNPVNHSLNLPLGNNAVPADMAGMITRFLPNQDLFKAQQVCKNWQKNLFNTLDPNKKTKMIELGRFKNRAIELRQRINDLNDPVESPKYLAKRDETNREIKLGAVSLVTGTSIGFLFQAGASLGCWSREENLSAVVTGMALCFTPVFLMTAKAASDLCKPVKKLILLLDLNDMERRIKNLSAELD